MIEEAAGTSLYETKREQTTKILEKKDSKLKEMDTLLAEEVQPRIEKLRDEQSQYTEFQRLVRDIEHLTHIHISYIYQQQKKGLEDCEAKLENVGKFIEDSKQKIVDNQKESEQIDDDCKTVQEAIDSNTGGELADLETELAKESKAEAVANGAKKSAENEIETEKRKLKTLQKNIGNDEKALETKETEMNNVAELFDSLKEADATDAKAFADAQKRFQAVSAGLVTNEDGEAASLQDQLMTAKKQLSEAKTTIKQCDMQLKHNTKMLNEKQNSRQTSDAAYTKDKQNHDNLEAKITQLTVCFRV